jgi:hypothetical protein
MRFGFFTVAGDDLLILGCEGFAEKEFEVLVFVIFFRFHGSECRGFFASSLL